MADNKQKHLEFIQGVITRMATNSFTIKGWAITLVSALFAFAASKDNEARLYFLIIACLPVIMFWILDGYFLWQERLYRELYNLVIKKEEAVIDFSMKPPTLSEPEGKPDQPKKSKCQENRNTWYCSTFSKTLNVFYGILIAVMTVIALLLVFLGNSQTPAG